MKVEREIEEMRGAIINLSAEVAKLRQFVVPLDPPTIPVIPELKAKVTAKAKGKK